MSSRGVGGFSELWGSESQRRAILQELNGELPNQGESCDQLLCFGDCYIRSLYEAALGDDPYALENLFGVNEDRRVPPIFRFGLGCKAEKMVEVARRETAK